jgi:uncharacterized alkaline shock family protein YloU
MDKSEEIKTEQVKISDEQILQKAVDAALSVEGVSGMSSTLSDSLMIIPGFGPPVKGAKLNVEDGELIIDLYINVKYQVKIPQLAWDIQSAVKRTAECVSHHKIKEVNIHVQGVDLPEEETND